MKKTLLMIIILMMTVQANASEYFQDWSKNDIILQSIFTIVTMIDWKQTKDFRKEDGLEVNPILGQEPDGETVDTMIGLAIISHAIVTWALPEEHREMWQMFWIGMETHAVYYNERARAVRESQASVNFKLKF